MTRAGRISARSALAACSVVIVGLVWPAGNANGDAGAPGSAPIGHAAPVYEVTTRKVGGLGRILVDGKGYSLYLFVPDHHSSRSTCTSICAVQWPPLVLPKGVAAPTAGPGVRPSLLGVTQRKGGTRQVTYGGWPLYLWHNDSAPGQATGQGLNNLGGLWYVVSPAGTAVR